MPALNKFTLDPTIFPQPQCPLKTQSFKCSGKAGELMKGHGGNRPSGEQRPWRSVSDHLSLLTGGFSPGIGSTLGSPRWHRILEHYGDPACVPKLAHLTCTPWNMEGQHCMGSESGSLGLYLGLAPGQSFNLAGPQFLHLQSRDNSSIYFKVLWR